MTIYDILKHHYSNGYKLHKGEIGLEIETESPTDYKIPKFAFWDVHNDGSLRQVGREYVLKVPLRFKEELPAALEEFEEKTKGIPFIQDSITTSVHVHMNILNENLTFLGNFLTTYSLVENLLIRFSGDDRRSNLFSLPMCDAEEIYYNIMRLMNGISKRQYGSLSFEPENSKYGALNLSAITRYGSLELRSFRGITDTKVIYEWVSLLYSIYQYAKQEKLVPPQIVLAYKDKGAEILSDIFSSEQRKLITQVNENELLEKNFWYSANIAHSIKDWTKLEQQQVAPKKTKAKDLESLAIRHYNRHFEALSNEQQQTLLNMPAQEDTEEALRRVANIDEAANIYREFVAGQAATGTGRTWREPITPLTTEPEPDFTDEEPEWHDDEDEED